MQESGRPASTESADPALSELFQPTHVIPELKATTREGVIIEVVKQVAQRGLVSDAKWLETALTERERMVPTAMPNGVAFLHARHRASEKFPRQFLFLARSPKGVSFGSPDERPTHLFFLLALRKDMAHLRWLARLAPPVTQDVIITNQMRLLGCLEVLDDLRAKLDERTAVFMITNPNTLGLFDEQHREWTLDQIAEADCVLSSGHLHISEIWPLFDEAKKRGVKRLLVNHPTFVVDASLGDIKELKHL